jgi:hypothetical protein
MAQGIEIIVEIVLLLGANMNEAVKVIDFFRTSVPENINHYLEHRDLKTDDVIGITVDGGYFYVFYKKTEYKEVRKSSPTLESGFPPRR